VNEGEDHPSDGLLPFSVRARRFTSDLVDACLSIIYPNSCGICGASVERRADGPACSACWENTRIFTEREIICDKCGAFLRSGPADTITTHCRLCDDDHFDRARSALFYEEAAALSVLSLKHTPFVPERVRRIFTACFVNSGFDDATKIIPVPLSRARLKERGFNQAALLARVLSRETGIPVDESILLRTVHTPRHRAGMDRKSRENTVKKVFEVVKPEVVGGERILLVDDVFTSGSTASSSAAELKKHGADKVYVFTLARA
jgi:ComF family protein